MVLSPPLHELGVLFVGHGTRNSLGQQQFLELAEAVQAKLPQYPLAPAFLELAAPSIDDAVKILSLSCKRLLTVPLLLFSAGHAKEDIPQAVQEACNRIGITSIGQTEPLQHLPPLLDLASQRYRQALTESDSAIPVNQRALLMLGRGSSDAVATRAMRHLTLLRREVDPVRYAGTAFFAVAKPTPLALFDYLAQRRTEELIVVQPHLLFDGLLWQQANNMVQEYQAKSPHRRWRITQPLGADLALAHAIAEIILQYLQRHTSLA